MNATELLSNLRHRGFNLIPEGDRLAVSPGSALTPELRQAIRERKQELLTLLEGQRFTPWPCSLCGEPAEIQSVECSPYNEGVLTFWHCEPCQAWGCTPDSLRQPPIMVPRTEQ